MECVTTSGSKTADAVIYAGPCFLHAVVLVGGSATGDVIVYDNPASAAGTKMTHVSALTTETAEVSFNNPVRALTGLYADVTGTGAEYYVYYSPI